MLQSLLHTLLQSFCVFGLHLETVDDYFDVVVFVTIHAHSSFRRAEFTIDSNVEKTFLANRLKEFFVVTFALFDERSQKMDFPPNILLKNEFENLFFGVFHHLFSTQIGVGVSSASKEQAQKVVDFCDGAHRGTRIFVGSLLLNADDGRESSDFVNIGTLEIVEKVACVSRKCFNISALSFGIERVESQR